MDHRRYLLLIISTFLLSSALIAAYLAYRNWMFSRIDTFDECAAAGYPVLETYPEQCKMPDGRVFSRDATSEELIKQAHPATN